MARSRPFIYKIPIEGCEAHVSDDDVACCDWSIFAFFPVISTGKKNYSVVSSGVTFTVGHCRNYSDSLFWALFAMPKDENTLHNARCQMTVIPLVYYLMDFHCRRWASIVQLLLHVALSSAFDHATWI